MIARRLLGAAAAAVARKLLPDAVPHNPGSSLALRSTGELMPLDRSNSFPTARPSQTLYAPPPVAAPAPPPRRRRKVVTETIVYEERGW